MSYQVLARKWRPGCFETFVGQSHVVRALTNALTEQRLHHAYLFTGTRGVGKTTLGRILAKCLNCEQGISAKPCDHCQSCQEITQGCFIDLIEVDAASRTKVEDTRELLENVPYAPTSGRFKIYLIDEVHMLSTHSFNALLKTLEEPPPHVKFFLATTDPQKLPITVLSRCLQFHLKSLMPEQITQQLIYILNQESLSYEEEALGRLARAAQGSLRDALSLLDQAIAFSQGNITTAHVKSMLSTIEETYFYDILEALAHKEAQPLVDITQKMTEKSLDCANALEELLSLLHQIALAQFIDNADVGSWEKSKISQFAQQFSPEDIQLFYQIALIGRKDLPLAPTPRIGLEMVLLRMLAFKPIENTSTLPPSTKSAPVPPSPAATPPTKAMEAFSTWDDLVPKLNLNGISAVIANHCTLENLTEDTIVLAIDPTQSLLLNKKQEERLQQALETYFKKPLQLTIQVGKAHANTPALKEQQIQTSKKIATEEAIQKDPHIQKILETFNGKIVPNSIETNET